MSDVVRRLMADDPNNEDTWIGAGTVTNAAAGTTSDGRRLITVDWRGTAFSSTYLAQYTPAVGHVVTFLKSGPSVLVIGQPARA